MDIQRWWCQHVTESKTGNIYFLFLLFHVHYDMLTKKLDGGADVAKKPRLHLWGLLYAGDGSASGRPTCGRFPGNIKQWSERQERFFFSSFHPLVYFFPSFSSQPIFLPSISSFRSLSLSWTKPDRWHAADVTVAIVTEALQQRGCVEMLRSVKR